MRKSEKQRILVQGMGCVETGAQIVLNELMKVAPPECRIYVLCTQQTAVKLKQLPDNVKVYGLSHEICGRWFRVLLELVVGFFGYFKFFDTIINLSHYGFCMGGSYVLYIHNPLLMDVCAETGWSNGNPNPIKRYFLESCLRKARLLVLQTDSMRRQLLNYVNSKKIDVVEYQLARPCVQVPETREVRRAYEFQLFYPTSRFPHKRADLAINAAREGLSGNGGAGLVITVQGNKEAEPSPCVRYLGVISRDEVYQWFKGSDALLFTSERETLGLPILEALAFGLPVIAPNLPYAVELLGEAGCYFDGDSVSEVVKAIHRCRDDYETWRERAVMRAVQIQSESLSWEKHWDLFLKGKS